MIDEQSRINIFTGHYGSGKTEVALNFAFYLRQIGKRVTIVDLDIVNPYFRTKDASASLIQAGIKVIAPTFANTNLDLPSLPANLISVFDDKDSSIIFDVGGDEDGATALSRYNAYFKQEPYNMFLVVNPNRPQSKTPEDIILTMQAIEHNSRLRVSYFVNNANIMQYTTPETVLAGQQILDTVSTLVGHKTAFISATEQIADSLTDCNIDILKLKLYLKPDWLIEG